ncbi:Mn transporter [Desulfovibrionales bacterium]
MIKRLKWRSVGLFFSLLGPGIITANVDNDAGGITTYSLAGAHYGYSLLWILLPITVALVVVQEMCARMGAVTGKGLSGLIRESFGVKITFYVMIALYLTNFSNTISEFAGIAASMEIFGISKLVSVPASALIVWLLIVKGSYRTVEKIFLVACLVYIAYPIAAIMSCSEWLVVARETFIPHFVPEAGYISMMIGIIGTTIAPWMQFYQQASVVEKGIVKEHYNFTKLDVYIGCLFAMIVAFFIVVACAATIHKQGLYVKTTANAALALAPIGGRHAATLFAFGLFNASLFAACVLPLSTSYSICEAIGWELGINKDFTRAPQFFWLFTVTIVISGVIILLPHALLIDIMYYSQVLNGAILPIILISIQRLVNDRRLMGDFINGPMYNTVAWIVVTGTTLLTTAMTLDLIVPGLLRRLFGQY